MGIKAESLILGK